MATLLPDIAQQFRRNSMEASLSQKILLTVRDVADIYGIPPSTQAKGRMKGGFCHFVKRGRSVYYLKTDFDEWIAGLRRSSTSDSGTGTRVHEKAGG